MALPSRTILESFENRNDAAYVCHSAANGLTDLNSKIDKCTTTTEQTRNNSFATNTFKIKKDIEILQANVGDSLMMGDSIFGKAGHAEIIREVKERNHDLKSKKETVMKDVDHKESIINRSNRDFTDVKDSLPETQPKKVLHFMEDYTLAILLMAYLFMVISCIYMYTATATIPMTALFNGIMISIPVTILAAMLLYTLA